MNINEIKWECRKLWQVADDYDNVEPIGLTHQQRYEYWVKKLNEYRLRMKIFLKEKLKRNRAKLYKKVFMLVVPMNKPIFLTIELNDKYVALSNKQCVRSVKNELKRIFKCKKVVLITDYGETTNRFHFHAFTDLEIPIEEIKKNSIYAGHYKKNGVGYCRYSYESKIGYVVVNVNDVYLDENFYTNSESVNAIKNAIGYSVKYAVKDAIPGSSFLHQVYTLGCIKKGKRKQHDLSFFQFQAV